MYHGYHISDYARNPEIKKQLLLYLLLGVAGAGVGTAFAWNSPAGISSMKILLPLLMMWGAAGIFHFAESYFRYCRIADLNSEIDRILHLENVILLPHMEEGELSILEDEINKMLTRLGEQNLELKREKTYLADSLTDLSHQLRTPLTSMNLILSMLERENLTQDKQMEYFARLKGLLQKVQWLIDVLLKISKLDADAIAFETQSCGFKEVVRDAFAPLEIPMELKRLTLVWEIAEGASFSGDRKWLTEAVENILKNCMEHTPEGGRITVSGKENTLFSELVIADNGRGIAQEDLPHILERFYKGKNSGEDSVGIGLALASMIVTKQNGTLKVENGKEGGARFCIRFYKGTL